MNYLRNLSIFFQKVNKYFFSTMGLIFTASTFAYNFWKDKPDSLVFGVIKLDMYDLVNIVWFISVFLSIAWFVSWLYVKNTPPFVSIMPYSPNGTRDFAYFKISNNEPQGLKSVRLNIINLIDKDGFDRVSHMGEFTNISKEVNLHKGATCRIDFAEGKNGALWIMADKRYEPLMARNSNEEYFVIFDMYAEPNKEGRELFCGRYEGKIIHSKYQNQDAISWSGDDFIKVSNKNKRILNT